MMAATYPTIIPVTMGMSLSSPLPNIDIMIVVTNAMMASSQLLFAMFTPAPASDKPMSMITGPTTMGGKSPAVKRATDGSMPTNSGTNTVEPNATNRNCAPTIVDFHML